MMPVTDVRTCVVTGVASGIGRALRDVLVGQGVQVIGVDRHDAEIITDIGTASGCQALVERVESLTQGRIDSVVACAGVARHPNTVGINYFGAIRTLEGLRPMLASSPTPRAVAVTSIGAIQPVNPRIVAACLAGDESITTSGESMEDPLAYTASKRALAIWMRQVAATSKWAGSGIVLNAVAPGVTDTPMMSPTLTQPAERARLLASAPMPLGWPAPARAVAETIAWLVSAQNSTVAGQVIFADAGYEVSVRPADTF